MKILDRVDALLNDKRFRDSDKRLLLAFWHTQGLELTPQQRDIFMNKCSTPESITRARRALREKHPASEVVEEERFEKYQQYKNESAVSWL